MARSIQSPGVEIIEKDLSLSPILPAGTNIFMTGFAQKGPTDEVLQITSVQELENVYGVPTNPSERYFYFGARQILNSSSGNLYISRIPYGDGSGDGYGSTYGALVYPVVAVTELPTVIVRNTKTIAASYFSGNAYLLTAILSNPTLSSQVTSLSTNGITTYNKYTQSQYESFKTGFTNYYVANVSNPSTSAFAMETNNLINYFLSGADTSVTTDLTNETCTYVLGAPKFFDLTLEQYQGVVDGSAFTNTNGVWAASAGSISDINSPADFGKAGLVVLNKQQSTINNRWEGHYIGLADNTNVQPNTDHNSIRKVYTNGTSASGVGLDTTDFIEIPTTKLSFPLSATTDSGSNRNSRSISEALEKVAYSFSDLATEKFDDTLSFGLFKLRTSPYNPDTVQLDFAFEDARTGSIDYYRQLNNPNGGIPNTFYLENIVNSSNNLVTLINSNLNSKNIGPSLDANGVPKRKVRVYTHNIVQSLIDQTENNYSRVGFHLNDVTTIAAAFDYADALFPAGSYSTFSTTGKSLGSLPLKIDRTLRKIENDELFDLDIVIEAGLGTMYATACANQVSYFDDTQVSSGLKEGLASITQNDYSAPELEYKNVRDNYNAIFTIFDNFVSQLRKDCIFISDPLRQIFVTGANTIVMNDHNKAFSQYIYNPLRHLYANANSSYSVAYGNWCKINDPFAGMNIWVPFSSYAAADIANVDKNFEPWYAPAGFTRGRITNVLAVAIQPKQKERDMQYRLGINPISYFPGDGINIFGQKTLLKQPSAFDRINVRRLFLYLEKATKKTTKYFIFEPNTTFTRNRVINTLKPIFERTKNSQGVYDYQLVCDTRNNTPSVIDQNELVVDIYIKPVRSAEFILVNFYATSTGTDFNELIGK